MMITIKLKDEPGLARVIKQAFPNYRKREAWISPMRPVRINSYWDGGSRDEFALVHLATGRILPMPTASHPYFDLRGASGSALHGAVTVDRGLATLNEWPEGVVLVQAGTFCGKPSTASVYIHPANWPARLTA